MPNTSNFAVHSSDPRPQYVPPPVLMGTLHPCVKAVALAVGAAGWRVSRSLAPRESSLSHARGIALDVCPQVWTRGGFGPRTAQLFWLLAKKVAPSVPWFVLSEDDHVHIQIADLDFLGTQLSQQDHFYYTPKLERITMTQSDVTRALLAQNILPEGPVGDYRVTESGDISFSNEVGSFSDEEGSYDEEGDFDETGAPRRKAANPRRIVAKARKKGSVQGSAIARLSKSNPAASRATLSAARAASLSRLDFVTYEHIKFGDVMTASLGKGARLRPRELDPLLIKLADFPSVQPRIIPFAWDGGTSSWQVRVSAALNTVLGIADGTVVPYLGGHITLPVSQLNRADNIQATISRGLGAGGLTLSTTLKLASQSGTPEMTFINGQIIAGQPRLYVPDVTVLSTDVTSAWLLSITGLSQNYQPQLRLFTPGDSETESFFGLIR